MRKTYLDNNATTPLHPKVLEAMLPFYKELYGNPSSIHHFGREVSGAIADARHKAADLLGCDVSELYFTSGGTEADNLAVIGTAFANSEKGKHVITSPIEHHAVLEACHFLEKQGYEVTYLPVDSKGFVDPDELKKAIRKDTTVVSIMHINNETGVVQDIPALAKIAKESGVYFHTDAVQSAGKVPINLKEFGVDMLSASAHKINGPKGTGLIYIKKGTRIQRLAHGGSHESGMRAGTENVAGMIGMVKALEISCEMMDSELEKYGRYSSKLWDGLNEKLSDIVLNGPADERRLKNTLNISFKGIESEAILLNLDMLGIGVASGSACSSGSTEPSHVMLAMGVKPEIARGSVRISFGKFTTDEDIEYTLEQLPPVIERLRKMSPVA
ncbi:MAG: aminotransferase class V-fold PLP-dependent enzyme [candidate division Zixibacteria bacterium]|nr:aminotransferase class V-fold PLP-dependent enzyme [candidate division Zixibacteria bacterium]